MDAIHRHVNYDQVAPTYIGRYDRGGYKGIEQALLQFAGDKPAQILEVGCGTGHWLEVLHASGHRVAGLDFSAGMLAYAQKSLPDVGLIRGQAEHLPLTAASFDRIFCINAFHHFVDKPAFLAEARRLLRPGGTIFTVGLDPHDQIKWYVYEYFPESCEIDKRRYPAPSVIQGWMRNAGFENCVTHEVEHWFLQLPAREILAQGRLDKAATSQLTVLTDEEYHQGIQRLQANIERAEAKGKTLFLTADMRLYGTYGSAG
jgi:SAM-dependent methyltransferase